MKSKDSNRGFKFIKSLWVVGLVAGSGALFAAGESHVANLSTRGQVGAGANVMVTGFVIAGSGPQKILLRAVGPGLSAFSVGGLLTDPVLTLYDSSGAVVNSNTGWSSADGATMTSVG